MTLLSWVIAIQASIACRFGQEVLRTAVGERRVAGCTRIGGRGGRLARDRSREGEADDERPAALEERLARKLLLMQQTRHDYAPAFAITAAACWIAVRIRG